MILKRTIATFATGALLFSAFAAPAFATTNLTISGNGASSTNTTTVTNNSSNVVEQSNVAHVTNDIDTHANTGDNTASANTGGDTMISTGKAVNTTTVSTVANLNKADLSGCGTCGGDQTVKISGNGANSLNAVDLTSTKETEVFQDNTAHITNGVDAHANTGKNDASLNTGGTTAIATGGASNDVMVQNQANANLATIGGRNGTSTGAMDVTISGNGAHSASSVDLTSDPSNVVEQSNSAWIDNSVDAKANTGKNTASANTGGDVLVRTGAAIQNVDVSNKVNFNSADLSCGCLTDVMAKISGNGTGSLNSLTADLGGNSEVFQGGGLPWIDGELPIDGIHGAGNFAHLDNTVDGKVSTGKNDPSLNTGVPADGVFVRTGDTQSTTTVDNASNVNVVGPFSGLTLPLGDMNVGFNFDLGALMGFLHFS